MDAPRNPLESEPAPDVQESVGASYAPQHAIRPSPTGSEVPVLATPGERRYDRLRKMGAEDFKGTTDPLIAERWLRETERIFSLMGYSEAEKLDYAMYLLRGDAYDWWETIPNSMAYPRVLTYEDFRREFHNNYLPAAYINAKQTEFLNLKQGSMTVAQYEVKFNQLSRYATSMVATEAAKCTRFEAGLRYEIRNKINPMNMNTFANLREVAVRAERLELERPSRPIQANRPGPYRGESSGSFGKRKGNFPFSPAQRGRGFSNSGGRFGFRGGPGSFSSRGYSQTQYTISICNQCGRRHEGECRMATRGCFHCGDFGHQFKDCPGRFAATPTPSEPTVETPRDRGFTYSRRRPRGGAVSSGGATSGSASHNIRPPTQARVYAITREEASVAPNVITGTLQFVLVIQLE